MTLAIALPTGVSLALFAVAYLLFKHAIADFFLQSAYQYKTKGIYGHPGGLLHSAIHVVLTAPVFLIVPAATPALAGLILAAEYVIHYHIDWSKEQLARRLALKPDMGGFWNAIGVDQMLHGWTYVGIVWLLTAR